MKTRTAPYWLAAFAACLTFLLYLPALRNGFVTWDDDVNVFANPAIRELSWPFFQWAFTDLTISYWQPLVWISHALDFAIWGLNPFGHHLTNNILHAANTFFVVVLTFRLVEWAFVLRNGKADEALSWERSALIAAGVSGLLFGLHPLHVESVAWVTERKDLLSTLFLLLSVLEYLRYARVTGQHRMMWFRDRRYWSAVAFFLLAAASKPMVVTLPAVLLLLDWYPLQRLGSMRQFLDALGEKLPLIAISLLVSVAAFAHKKYEAVLSLRDSPLTERVLAASRAVVIYLRQMVLPIDLSPYYPDPKDLGALSVAHLAPLIMVCGITAVCVFLARKQKVFPAAWAYFMITLAPVLGLIKTRSVIVADRFTYLPSIAPFLLAGLGAAWLWDRREGMRGQARMVRRIIAGAGILFVIALCWGTVKQIAVWRNGVALWTRVIDEEPVRAPVAYNNRALAYQSQGRFDEAVRDLTTLIALDGTAPGPYNNRGVVLRQAGLPERAIADHTTAIRLKPDLAASYTARGLAFKAAGKVELALKDFDRALRLDPNDADAYAGRGWTFHDQGRKDRALEDYDRAIALDPRSSFALNSRGLALQEAGQVDRAIADFSRAIRVNPSFAEALVNRGLAYEQMGRLDDAMADYTKAIAADPSFASAYNDRALLLERKGMNEQALADLNTAIRLNPSGVEAYNNRGLVYEGTGRLEQAIVDYSRAIELAPDDYLGYSNRGIAYRKLGRCDLAIGNLTKAIVLRPDLAEAYFDRGECYRETGRRREAMADHRRACTLGYGAACSSIQRQPE